MDGDFAAGAVRVVPQVGFCTRISCSGKHTGTLFLNFCCHPAIGMPQGPGGKEVDRDWIARVGIANSHIPLDIGSWRRIKSGEGKVYFAVDIVYHPAIIKLAMDENFCNSQPSYREHLFTLTMRSVEKYCKGVKLAMDMKYVRDQRYKGGEGPKGDRPVDFQEISEETTEAPPPRPAPKKSEPEPMIKEVSSKPKTSAVKAGFLQDTKGCLYPEGSPEGVLPENAGDPMGWMPKKLRQTCKIVDTANPEYQKAEAAQKQANQKNEISEEFQKELASWTKAATPDHWAEDVPDKIEDGPPKDKYSVDYSRFDEIKDDDDDAAPKPEDRDFYYDDKGNIKSMPKQATPARSTAPNASASTGAQKAATSETVKKGFLDTPAAKASTAAPQGAVEPQYTTETVEVDGTQCLRFTIETPQLASMAQAELDVSRTQLRFEVKDLYLLETKLSNPVNSAAVRAKFSRKARSVTVTLPFEAAA